eukprot:COSAG04_NODE_799_length_10204_cov_5.635131_10_plen_205_part_00
MRIYLVDLAAEVHGGQHCTLRVVVVRGRQAERRHDARTLVVHREPASNSQPLSIRKSTARRLFVRKSTQSRARPLEFSNRVWGFAPHEVPTVVVERLLDEADDSLHLLQLRDPHRRQVDPFHLRARNTHTRRDQDVLVACLGMKSLWLLLSTLLYSLSLFRHSRPGHRLITRSLESLLCRASHDQGWSALCRVGLRWFCVWSAP